jgi:hypothetical protein
VVTVATSWLGPAVGHHGAIRLWHERCMTALREAIARVRAMRPSLRFVLKLHPSEPAHEAERMRAAAGAPDLVVRERSPHVLAASDVLITLPSTIAVEAMILGTPVISPEFFYDGDAVLAVPGHTEPLAAAIAHVLDGWGRSDDFEARRRRFVARHNGPCDGRAAERVAQLVEETVARLPRRPAPADAPGRPHWLAAADLLLGADHPASALVVLAEAPRGPAEEAESEMLRAHAFVRLGRPAEAEAAFRRAIAAGGDGRAHVGLGLMLLERGARDEAGVRLRAGIARDPALDAGWAGLGVLAALEGEEAQAIALLEHALRLNPMNPDALGALAVLRPSSAARGGQDPGTSL